MDYAQKAEELVSKMTLAEKASLMSGKDFWHLKGNTNFNLPEIMVTDGPHGLRKQVGHADHLGLSESIKAVCFPTASTTANSFDRDLIYKIGVALGEECRQEEISVLLGPGVNIKRSPLCGRNFEYVSEDPYLTGQMGAALVSGIQSQSVGVSVKHYAVNNQETRRMICNAVVDERALREIYLAAFEHIVVAAHPWTLMCSYNPINGTYGAQHKKLLTDILREEWGFDGLVMTDWGAVTDRVEGIKAGLDLQMPGDGGMFDRKVAEAVEEGELSEAELNKAAVRVVSLILRSQARKRMEYDIHSHRTLAIKATAESSVLLKNEGALPIREGESVAVVGAFAKQPRYQGTGSSKVNPIKIDTLYDVLVQRGISFSYADGYDLTQQATAQDLIDTACEAVKGKDKVYIIAGLPDAYESEGFDRKDMSMPRAQNELIEKLCSVHNNCCVVLLCGSPVEMPWHDQVKGILLAGLGGEGGGVALADLLFGLSAPGGRLAETWPLSVQDNPSFNYFPGCERSVEYRESIYVGYRYYDTAKAAVRYPFGHGLTYTSFKYEKLTADRESMHDEDTLRVSVQLRNTGKQEGSEVVQLYVSHKNPTIFKAEQELKGFEKVRLKAGESAEVTFVLDKRSFAYYSKEASGWVVETGEYEIRVGGSSRDRRLKTVIHIEGKECTEALSYRESAPSYYHLSQGIAAVPDEEFVAVLGHELPARKREEGCPHTANSTFLDITDTKMGRHIYNFARRGIRKTVGDEEAINAMAQAMFNDMPLRMLYMMGQGKFTPDMMEGLLHVIEGRFGKGIKAFFTRKKKRIVTG